MINKFFTKLNNWRRDYRIARRKQQIVNWNIERKTIIQAEEARIAKQCALKERQKLTLTKRIVVFLLVNFTIIEIFALYTMYKFQDLSALPTLITTVIGEVVAFAIYAYKSLKENSSGGIVYDAVMRNNNNDGPGCAG